MSDTVEELKSKLRDAESATRVAEAAVTESNSGRKKLAIWSAIGGFVLFAAGGHWFPGYQLDSTAESNAMRASNAAVMNVMATLCASRFLQEPGADERLASLEKQTGDWSKAAYIRKGDWASAPDGESTDHNTADKCREIIAERVAESTAKTS